MAAPAALPPELEAAAADPDETMRLLDAYEAEQSLRAYTHLVWHVLEPGRPLVYGWHMDAIGEHLEAVTAGEIKRLVINVPPGFSKSLLTNVIWPSHEWGPCDKPYLRYLSFSYAQQLTVRDNRRCRNLINSPLYQRLWGHRFSLVSDQNAKIRYDTNQAGFRLASSVGGTGTGERGDRVVIDDPNNVREAESERITESTLLWLSEVVPSRTTDIRTSAIVLIQQRTGVNDCTGHILKSELGYEWVCYDDQTEVLTEVGWRRFADVLYGVRVMGVDPTTLFGRWERPYRTIRKHYNGPMIHWNSMTTDVAVTPDHRMVYGDVNDRRQRWRIGRALSLPQDFYLPQALSRWNGEDKPITLGGRLWDPMIYAAFMGWYLSEGNASARGCYTLITQNAGRKSDQIADLLDRTPFEWQRYEYPRKAGRFQIGSKQLARDLQFLGKSHTKRIPRRLIDLGRRALEAFIQAYIDGDGRRGGIFRDRPSISTMSPGMADDLQEVAVKLGWAASIERKKSGANVLHLKRSKALGRPRKAWSKISTGQRRIINYDGEVFCLSVASGALVVRRNDRVAISGNCLPMEFERANPCFTPVRRKGVRTRKVRLVQLEEETIPRWIPAKKKAEGLVVREGPVRTLTPQDRRTKEGQLLDPERFPRDSIEQDLKKPLRSRGGEAAVAGQLQQRPQPKGGTMFKREEFKFILPDELPPGLRWARGYDLAGSKKTKSASAGVKIAVDFQTDRVFIGDASRVRYESGEVITWMQALAELDGWDVQIDFPQDPGQAGKWQKPFVGGKLGGYQVFSSPESGSKDDRAQPLASQVSLGNVYLVHGAWNDAFIAEAVNFPRGDFKDQIDAAARAYARALKRAKQAPPSEGPKMFR